MYTLKNVRTFDRYLCKLNNRCLLNLFSMLLLEPGEIYFEDYSAVWLQNDLEKQICIEKIDGRVKLCSKSLVFEPKDRIKPLIKIQFKECQDISQSKCILNINSNSIITIKCKQYAEMLEGNVIAPYKFKVEEKEFLFLLNYASVTDCIQQMNQLKRASTLHACEQNSMIATISHSRYSRLRFDLLWLDDLYDKILLEVNADKISPLVQNPGKVVLTANTLFFQPCNNLESSPVLKIKIGSIRRLFKRRFLLRQIGLEIYNTLDSEISHLYLAFKSQGERDDLFENIMNLPNLSLDNMEQNEMTMQWQNGVLSNYDYLLYLNCMADRTKNDLTQYPVFPWVLSNYTSSDIDLSDINNYRDLMKPIGALNEERLERLKERYAEMAEPKFLYGSHYSAPGLVLFYIVRTCPHFMLCLQNGRFDHPDRMFNCLSDVYRNCLNNMADFKELIPEFYDIENKGDFLVNKYGIQFGYKHDGVKVGDVVLPPWADSPEHFIKTMREALESDHVSRNLHHWIDLIFGYKQREKESEKADNVFFHLCYEGTINLDDIIDMNERHALEVQIMEFGQIPRQLFNTPHVRRIINTIQKSISDNNNFCVNDLQTSLIRINTLREKLSFHSHKSNVNCVIISNNEQFIVSVGADALLKVYSLKEQRQTRSVNIGSLSLSSCVQMNDNTLILGSWDNNITVYDLEYGRIVDTFRAHDDSVSCLLWSPDERLLISAGWDCVVRSWISSGFSKGSFKPLRSLPVEFDHDSKVTCVAINKSSTILVTGTDDGDVTSWNLNRKTKKLLATYNSTVTGVCFISDDRRLVISTIDGEFRVIDLGVNTQIFSKNINEGLTAIAHCDNFLYLGGVDGNLYLWDLLTVAQICEVKAHNDAINSIAVSMKISICVTGSKDHHVKVWDLTLTEKS